MNKPHISLKIVSKKDNLVKGVATRKIRRIYHYIQAVKNSEIEKVMIRVTYGTIVDNYGHKVKAINDGEYQTKEELRYAIKCFTEK